MKREERLAAAKGLSGRKMSFAASRDEPSEEAVMRPRPYFFTFYPFIALIESGINENDIYFQKIKKNGGREASVKARQWEGLLRLPENLYEPFWIFNRIKEMERPITKDQEGKNMEKEKKFVLHDEDLEKASGGADKRHLYHISCSNPKCKWYRNCTVTG